MFLKLRREYNPMCRRGIETKVRAENATRDVTAAVREVARRSTLAAPIWDRSPFLIGHCAETVLSCDSIRFILLCAKLPPQIRGNKMPV